jgi:hypothetical protein
MIFLCKNNNNKIKQNKKVNFDFIIFTRVIL